MDDHHHHRRRRCRLLVPLLLFLLGHCSDGAHGFEEYYMDHKVTEKDAKAAYFVAIADITSKPLPNWCSTTVPCTDEIARYCSSRMLINDHCCCDHGHMTEILPWIPHSCYVGKDRCTPAASSCMAYTEIRECCCDKLLAEEWKDIFSSAAIIESHPYLLYSTELIVMLGVRYALRRISP